MALVALRHVGISQTRDWTGVPCIARRILNPWAPREARDCVVEWKMYSCEWPEGGEAIEEASVVAWCISQVPTRRQTTSIVRKFDIKNFFQNCGHLCNLMWNLSVQSSGTRYIHTDVSPSPACGSRMFSPSQIETYPLINHSPFVSLSSPWPSLFYFLSLWIWPL